MPRPRKAKGFIAQFGHLTGAGKVAENLGHMTAAWSFLENQLALLLKQLTSTDEETAFAIMYAQNATSSRVAIVQQLVARLPEGDAFRSKCETTLTETIRLMNRRNSLTHHLWVVDTGTGKAYTFDYRQLPDTQARRQRRTDRSVALFTNEILANCQSYASLLRQNLQQGTP